MPKSFPKEFYKYKNPEMLDYKGKATELTLIFTRKDFGELNPAVISERQLDTILNKIYVEKNVIPISCRAIEKEPVKTFYGWRREFKIVLVAIALRPSNNNLSGLSAVLTGATIAAVKLIFVGILAVVGLTLVDDIAKTVLVEGGEVVRTTIPWITVGIGFIAVAVVSYILIVKKQPKKIAYVKDNS